MSVAQTNLAWETLLDLSTTKPGPLHGRLAEAIRTAVRDGRVPLGAALPPSRTLASDLGVSRWTVTQAYGQLITEGYLSGKTGSATRVSWSPEPDDRRAPEPRPVSPPVVVSRQRLSIRYDLTQWAPDYRAFPRRKWVESIRIAAETAPYDRLGYAEPGGEPRLREVLAAHLDRRRGTHIDPGLMSLFTGARHSMAAICRALVEDGHRRIAVEDPGSTGLLDAARAAGLELVGLPVDDDGARVEGLTTRHCDVRAVLVGPAHHPVTGALLSPARRAALLEWVRRVDGLIIEDDYDSEFSYNGPALPAIQGSDPYRVALLGSMSRTMTASVNVGWVVVPRRYLSAVRAGAESSVAAPALNQSALAHFLESGEYDRHLRSLRRRFRARRDALVAALAERLPECRIKGQQAGVHIVLELPPGATGSAITAAAAKRGMAMCDVNFARLNGMADEERLSVGYANLPDRLVAEAVDVLVELIQASVTQVSR